MKTAIPFFIASTILAGCAAKPDHHQDNSEIFFETKINTDGTKLFAFSIGMDKGRNSDKAKGKGQRPGGNGERPPRGERGQSDNAQVSEKQMDMFYQLLADKLDETQYCREGYIEIDTHETEDRHHLLGECNDSASEMDRLEFPNVY